MIPIADENPVRRIPVVTILLIAACVVVYFVIQPTGTPKFEWDTVVEQFDEEDLRFAVDNAAIPCELIRGRPLTQAEFERTYERGNDGDLSSCSDADGPKHAPGKDVFLALIATMFLHGSIAHLFGNMVFLWVFGSNLEERSGWLRYLLLYLVGGIVATAAHVVVDPDSTLPLIGASGAVAAVMGAYFVQWPNVRMKTMIVLGPIFLRKVQALWLLIIWLAENLLLVAGPSGIAWAAHLGGFAFGALFGLWRRYRERARERAVGEPALIT